MLVYEYQSWERLLREHVFTVDGREPADYELPADFAYMISQTGWMRDQNVPLQGPLSAQDWQYLTGRDLVTSTIYASFRISEGVLKLFPTQSNFLGEEIAYEYMSRNWVQPAGETNPDMFTNKPSLSSDVILFQDPLPSLALAARYLTAKGMDSTAANAEFSSIFLSMTGADRSAPILSARGRSRGAVPFLNAWNNVPDTGFGSI